MRGKLDGRAEQQSERRIIPAHAGQTAGRAEQFSFRADHPRACGANSPILCENS